MPTVNKISCAILLPPTDTPLPEYHRRYLDSSVSVYVPVPDIPILHAAPSFNIQLWTDGYIAPGLAMFVYIDGRYQCNRSKRMPPPGSVAKGGGDGGGGIEMRVRQKEEKVKGFAGGEGEFVGREWRWVHLDVEQADGASYSDVDMQHIGKIEVVVLRCDYDDLPAVEPRAPAAMLAGPAPAATKTFVRPPSGRAPSGRAPSGRAPSGRATSGRASSGKAPSAKPASAASAALAGLFGAFDGACDLEMEDASDDSSLNAPHAEYADRGWKADNKPLSLSMHPSNDHDVTSSLTCTCFDQPADQSFIPPFGLDRNDYDYPEMVYDQYGRLPEPRVPYYHTSGTRRPRQKYVDDAPASLEFLPPQVPPQTPRQAIRRVEFDPHESTVYYSPPKHHPPYPESPVGISYHNERYLPRRSPSPQERRHRSRSRGRTHERSVRLVEQTLEELPDINPDFQRYHIFRMPEKFEALLGVDHRFIADAVPHIPQLQTIPVTELGVEALEMLKRNLNACLDRGRYPNGDLIRILEEPRDRERRLAREEASARRISVDRGRREPHSASNDAVADNTSIDAFAEAAEKYGDKAKHSDRQSKQEDEHERGRKHKRDKNHKHDKKDEKDSKHKHNDSHKSEKKHKHDRRHKREGRHRSKDRDSFGERAKSKERPKSEDSHKHGDEHKSDKKDKHGKKHKHDKKKKRKDKKHKKIDKHERKDRNKKKHKSDRSGDSRSSSPSIEFFSSGGWSQKGSVKSQSGSHKHSRSSVRSSSTSSSGSSSSSGSWSSSSSSSSSQKSSTSNQGNSGDWETGNQGGQAGWDNSGGDQNKQGGDNWANNNNNQVSTQKTGTAQQHLPRDEPLDTGQQNAPQDAAPNTGDGVPLGRISNRAPSSYFSVSSRSTNPHAYVQPYFQTWRGNGQTPAAKPLPRQPREPYTYGPAPTPHLPADRVGNRSHGVRAGRGADYSHKVYHPKYLDTLGDPYAVFVFNYRSAEELEHMFRHDVKGDLASIAEEVGRGVLMNLPREKLVEELMKAQAQAPVGGNAGGSRQGDVTAPTPQGARSNKAPSRAPSQAQKSVIAWANQAAQPAAGQDQGFKPVSVRGDKGGQAAGGGGWNFEGGGTTGQEGGFTAEGPVAANINW